MRIDSGQLFGNGSPVGCSAESARRLFLPFVKRPWAVSAAKTKRRHVNNAVPLRDITNVSSSSPSLTERSLPAEFAVQSPDGRWRVRPIDINNREEIGTVVRLQAEGFHEPNPIPFLDATFKRFFSAESTHLPTSLRLNPSCLDAALATQVLSVMMVKLKYNPADRFVCLVVEDSLGVVIGVAEVSYLDEKEVLASLPPGTLGFVYIASMTVDPSRRRQGAASALLLPAETVAKIWSEEALHLHVFQDNISAVGLYRYHGFQCIYQDAPWLAKVGIRPRFLMRKTLLQ